MLNSATLRLTKSIPKEHNYYPGGICTYKDATTNGEQFYFGWRDKGAISYPVGEAIQRSLVLFRRYKYTEVTIIIEAELTEEKQTQVIIVKPQ